MAIHFEAHADVILSEFKASKSETLLDDFDESEDWIELTNTGSTNVNLVDWALTDHAGNLFKWRFPATNLTPGGYMIVFASDRKRKTPGQPLHTNFKLDPHGDGMSNLKEYLSHTDPQDSTCVLKLDAQAVEGGRIELSFLALADLAYTIQSAATLSPAAWTNWQQISAAATTRTVRLTNSVSPPPVRQFRLVTPPS